MHTKRIVIFINFIQEKDTMQKKVKSFDNVKINYDLTKKSDLFLIFIHGAGGDLNAWKKERKFFDKKGFSTLAIDLRGHGLSDRPDLVENYKLENFANDIYSILKKEKIKNFIIIGHCFGGMITITFHKLFPKLAKSYILIDTTYKAPQSLTIFKQHPFFVHILNHLLENKDLKKKHFSHVNYDKFIGTSEWNFKRIYSDITHTSLKSWLFMYENIANFDGIKILKNMNKPVLIIEGNKDRIFPPTIAKKIHKLIKTSEIDIIPNANHILVLNNVKVLEKDILTYISKISEFIGSQKSSQ
jgi:pimeloyl-ACP methyl ester carboxylesterase